MKKGIHPTAYRPVVFKDMSNGYTFLSRSTAASKETITFEGDGQEYPLIKLEAVLINSKNATKRKQNNLVGQYPNLRLFFMAIL